MNNVAQVVAKHNAKVIAEKRTKTTAKEGCNCQDKPTCPLPGRCQTAGVVYKANIAPQVLTNNIKVETYTGLTSKTFKKRHYGHDHDIKEEKKDETGTTLSRHIHKLREAGTDFDITWDLLERRIAGYNPISKQCRLKWMERDLCEFTFTF